MGKRTSKINIVIDGRLVEVQVRLDLVPVVVWVLSQKPDVVQRN